MSKWEKMKEVAQNDLEALRRAENSYGNSWRRRGGGWSLYDVGT